MQDILGIEKNALMTTMSLFVWVKSSTFLQKDINKVPRNKLYAVWPA